MYGTKASTLNRLARVADATETDTDYMFSFDEKRGGDSTDRNFSNAKSCYAIKFLDALAEKHALPDPGRTTRVGLFLQLPSFFTKKYCHKLYSRDVASKNGKPLSPTAFFTLRNDCRPKL